MATVYQTLLPEEAQFLATAFPQFVKNAGTNFPVSGLAYDAATQESAYWKFRAINYGSGNITIDLYWHATTVTTGTVCWEAQISAITPDTDTQDISTDALATLNYIQDTHLTTTAKRLHTCAIALSNLDSIAANDICHLKIARDADGTNATDTITEDVTLIMAVISYSDT
jgi:hypothetical protein